MTLDGLKIKNIAKSNLIYFVFFIFLILQFVRFFFLELILDEPAMVLRYQPPSLSKRISWHLNDLMLAFNYHA